MCARLRAFARVKNNQSGLTLLGTDGNTSLCCTSSLFPLLQSQSLCLLCFLICLCSAVPSSVRGQRLSKFYKLVGLGRYG